MDIKNIKQFGGRRFGVNQDKKLCYYKASDDLFIFIDHPDNTGDILSYNPATGAYSWVGTDYIYVNDGADPIDPPNVNPDPPVSNTQVMLRFTIPENPLDENGNILVGESWVGFNNFNGLTVKTSLGGKVVDSRYAAIKLPANEGDIVDMYITGNIVDFTTLFFHTYVKVTGADVEIDAVNIPCEMFIPAYYTNLTQLKAEANLTAITFENAISNSNLQYILFGSLELATGSLDINYPNTTVDLSLFTGLYGFASTLYTNTSQTETILSQLVDSLPTYSGSPSGTGLGLVVLHNAQSISDAAQSSIDALRNKGYTVNVIV